MRRYLSRKLPHRLPKKLFIISSEGKETEPKYFKKFNSDKIRVVIVDERFGTDPISVVNAAKNYKDKNDIKRGDEIWVIIDTDFSPDTRRKKEEQLTEAGEQCSKCGFGYAVSNPCFEFWLLLHFEETPSFSSTIRIQDECIRRFKIYFPYYGKSTYDTRIFADKIEFAIKNAKILDRSRNKLWPQNHGSTVYSLVERLLEKQ